MGLSRSAGTGRSADKQGLGPQTPGLKYYLLLIQILFCALLILPGAFVPVRRSRWAGLILL